MRPDRRTRTSSPRHPTSPNAPPLRCPRSLIPTPLQTVRRHLVDAAIGTARLPLTAAQRVVGPDDAETWPPTLAADALAAFVRQLTGSLLHDDEMARRGRLEQAGVAERRLAAEQGGRARR